MKLCETSPYVRICRHRAFGNKFASKSGVYADHRIFYCTDGIVHVSVDGRELTLAPSDLIYIPAGTLVSLRSPRPSSLDIIGFDIIERKEAVPDRLLPPDELDISLLARDIPKDAEPLASVRYFSDAYEMSVMVDVISAAFTLGRLDARAEASAALKRLLCLITRDALGEENSRAVKAVLEYLHQMHSRPIENAELADILGCHPNYINEVFPAFTGMTVHRYLMKIRLEYAAVDLARGDMQLRDIALLHGLTTSSYLCRMFKEEYGLTPKEYRNKMKSEI